MRSLAVWMVASEAAPWAQTGGLADVLRALPRALAARGHRVRVFLPAYGRIDRAGFAHDPAEDHHAVPVGIARVPVRFLTRDDGNGVRVTLVQSEEMFAREGYYGPHGGDYPDNARRFALLSAAVAALAARGAEPPDILHGHDWQAALLPAQVRFALPWPGRRPATVHTIHNMGYQGRFGAHDLDWVAPPGPLRDHLFRADGLEDMGGINYMKAALAWADRLTAVSPRYAWEITTMEGGFGLHDAAWRRGGDLVGILNGADYEHWDPSRDPHIPEPYDASTLERKEASRRDLRDAFGLRPREAGASTAPDRPILGVVSRLVDQKGIDVLLQASPALIDAGADLVILGAGDQRIVDGLENLRRVRPDRVGIYIGFNEPLSHRIVAGSDVLMIPSRYEPCGLVQMHAMRYGTIPVVHRTGGLADTVRDADEHPGTGTGFVFDGVAPGSLAWAARRAVERRAADPGAWRAMMRRAMAEDFSWERSAGRYEEVYAGLAG